MAAFSRLDPDLLGRITTVKRQCERRRWFGALYRLAVTTAALIVALTLFLYLSEASAALRNITLVTFLGVEVVLVWRWLVPIFRNPVSMEQVGLYIDEHYPELENRIVNLVNLDAQAGPLNNSVVVRKFLRESQDFVLNSSFK